MIDKGILKYKNIASIIAIIMLVLVIPSGLWPYGYYILLRWVVTGAALLGLWNAHELKKQSWVIIMALIAIFFNPIAPIHLDKGTWIVIDFIVAGLFLISIFNSKK
jgi:hypothetical protein